MITWKAVTTELRSGAFLWKQTIKAVLGLLKWIYSSHGQFFPLYGEASKILTMYRDWQTQASARTEIHSDASGIVVRDGRHTLSI